MTTPNNQTINCIIVDDEPMARDVLRRYIDKLPHLTLLAEFGNGIDAMIYIPHHQVDLIFLDIRMPQLTGTEFIKSIQIHPKIIITTAHKEYAFEGFELDVTDYLLKPIRFDRFLRAVNKSFPRKDAQATALHAVNDPNKSSDSFIYVRVDRKMVKVFLQQIQYIESDKDYAKIYTDQGCIITRQTIRSIESMLTESQFVRIHRSFIVSLAKLTSYTPETVDIGQKELPVGKLYRSNFIKLQQL
jgi:two-component system, LytTR family, response regulator